MRKAGCNGMKLKRCPFCGGKAEVGYGESFMHKTAFIYCMDCHIRTKPQMEGMTMPYNGKPGTYISLEKCKQMASSEWNRRVHDTYMVMSEGEAGA